jgi:Tfp pilus assembly protein PilZ
MVKVLDFGDGVVVELQLLQIVQSVQVLNGQDVYCEPSEAQKKQETVILLL